MKNKFIVATVSSLAIFVGYLTLSPIAQSANNFASPPLAPIGISSDAPKVDENLSSGRQLKTTLVVTELKGTIRNPYYEIPDHVQLRGYRCEKTPADTSLMLGAQEFNFDHCLDYSETSLKRDANKKTSGSASSVAVLVAPTLEISPGDQLEITVKNQLPQNADKHCTDPSSDINTPHCFNNTNLHTHGLWVDPDTEDDVLTSIQPGESKVYRYNIRRDHAAGTFWYHPHVHGSTAIQVGSGMVGALIIRGDRKPIELKSEALNPDDNSYVFKADSMADIRIQRGDLDSLLTPFCRPGPSGEANCKGGVISRASHVPIEEIPLIEERVLLFQQIQYACGSVVVDKEGVSKPAQCPENNPGKLDSYDNLGPSGWKDSLRHTTINGLVVPTYKTTANIIQRLRMIHGGVRDTINVQVYKLKSDQDKNLLFKTTGLVISDAEKAKIVEGSPLNQFMVATDGLTLPYIAEQHQTVLQPGYRADVLMNFPETGTYVVFDGPTPASGTINQTQPDREVLAFFEVAPSAQVAMDRQPSAVGSSNDEVAFVRDTLITLAERRFSGRIRDKIIADLKPVPGVMSLDSFVAHSPISENQLTTTLPRKVEFNIDVTRSPALFQINDESFSGTKVDQLLKLNDVEEWHLTSKLAGHPFHIHVNPFEVVAVYNPLGIDVSGPRQLFDKQTYLGKDNVSGTNMEITLSLDEDLQYANLKGAFKDTIFVKPGYKVVVRSHYKVFDGDFVLHCHILDHEDQGMMQYVRIWGGKNNPEPDGPLRGSHKSTSHHSGH